MYTVKLLVVSLFIYTFAILDLTYFKLVHPLLDIGLIIATIGWIGTSILIMWEIIKCLETKQQSGM